MRLIFFSVGRVVFLAMRFFAKLAFADGFLLVKPKLAFGFLLVESTLASGFLFAESKLASGFLFVKSARVDGFLCAKLFPELLFELRPADRRLLLNPLSFFS